jgi:hypothetical protein
MSKSKKIKLHTMVGWYDPLQLAKTGIEVAISTIFGRHSDRRLLQAAAKTGGQPEQPFYSPPVGAPADDYWFDYVADVGDGFNPTCTVAYYLTEPSLTLGRQREPSDKTAGLQHETKPGSILIFGGDEVYPIAQKDIYEEKLQAPYNAVFPKKEVPDPAAPLVFSIPGNHDWYDSLAQFSFIFLEDHFGKQRSFCGWKSIQERSYFAIKLPHGWWLFGTDMQLGSTLDSPQMSYFRNVVDNCMAADDRIILCNAEPHWITRAMYPDNHDFDNENIGFFEGRILKNKTVVFIAGDRHYYRRHQEILKKRPDGTTEERPRKQRIVAGGGGAFLHPTHKENVDSVGSKPQFELKASFPRPSTSSWLNFWNLLFILWNWKFGLATGVLYLLTAHAFQSNLGKFGWSDRYSAVREVFHDFLREPFSMFWVFLILCSFILFTDTASKPYKWVAGTIHGLTHLLAVFAVGWGAARLIDPVNGIDYTSIRHLLYTAALVFGGGFILGATIMGLYLLISLNIFGRHHNEAFSALKIQDYKNFIRFKIDGSGRLTIYPIGIEKVIRSWPKSFRGRIAPENGAKAEVFLIEDPISVGPYRESETATRGKT